MTIHKTLNIESIFFYCKQKSKNQKKTLVGKKGV